MNIILIILDTLSALHLPEYGYHRNTTPDLTPILKKENFVLFKNAYSTSCWTSPSHASIFTGLYPSQHGVNEVDLKLRDDYYSLAEILQEMGYKTIGISSNGLIIRELGFARGFSHFLQLDRWEIFLRPERFSKFKRIAAAQGNLRAIPYWIWKEKSFKEPLNFLISAMHRWVKHKLAIGSTVVRHSRPYTEKALKLALRAYREEDKFFLFLNLMETHHRYRPPKPFRGKWSHGKMGKWEKIPPRRHYTRSRFPKSVIEHLRNLYDEEILFLQNLLKDFLLKAMEDREKFNRTLWIITSDHGEAFGEGGHMEHMVSLEEANIRVPLWIKFPTSTDEGIGEKLVQLNDLFALILEQIESPFPIPRVSISPLSGERLWAKAEIPRLDYLKTLINNPEDFTLKREVFIRKESLLSSPPSR